MILSGLTINFMLYENEFGLAISRLCHLFNFQINFMSLLLTQTKDILENNRTIREESFLPSYKYVVKVRCLRSVDVLLVCAHTKDHVERYMAFEHYPSKYCSSYSSNEKPNFE